MTALPRQYPERLPKVRLVPEYSASGELKTQYEDVKQVLQVPWMGVVTMAFAHYRRFFEVLWQGIRPVCRSVPFVESALRLRAVAEQRAGKLEPPAIRPRLAELGYAERELADIGSIVEVFSHGNQPYLLIATIARLLLEGEEMSSGTGAPVFSGRHAPDADVPLVLMEPHHADEPTRAVYQDVRATIGLPFVNTDYRALARWPSYFALAWSDIRPVLQRPDYEGACQAVHDEAISSVTGSLPNPGALRSEALREAAQADGEVDEILDVCRLFQWLLPGLIVNVAFFRHALAKS